MRKFFHSGLGLYIDEGSQFTLDGITYPANWLGLAKPGEIGARGLTVVKTVGVRGDDALFVNTETLFGDTLSIVATPKNPTDILFAKSCAAVEDRNSRLASTDWFVMRHRDQIDSGSLTDLSDEQYTKLLAFRQNLRDVTEQAGYPETIIWPELSLGI